LNSQNLPRIGLLLCLLTTLAGCPAGGEDKPPPGSGTPDPPTTPETTPQIVSLRAAAASVEAGGMIEVSAARNDQRFHLFWQSSCGIIAPDPTGNQAVFFAPDLPGTCSITVTIADEVMDNSHDRSIDMLVLPSDEMEVAL
jgi:hypothetical protein